MEWYKNEHNGQQLWDVNSDISKDETNATICEAYYREINNKNVDGKLGNICLCCLEYHHIQQFYWQLVSTTKFNFIPDLRYARCFSARNSFGPVPLPPTIFTTDDQNLVHFRVLHTLLTNMTAAEEATIQQICPLICIKSLHGGNIAAKGNTHCV